MELEQVVVNFEASLLKPKALDLINSYLNCIENNKLKYAA